MKKSSKSGPQGPISKNTQSIAKSKKNETEDSLVLGTSTNKQAAVRGLTPKPSKSKKR